MFKGRLQVLPFIACVMLGLTSLQAWAGKNDVLAELRFKADSRVEKNAGVWVDGQYLGFLKELKRSKKVLLLPGNHSITIKRVGYGDFTAQLALEPGQVTVLPVKLTENPEAEYPTETGRVRLDIEPDRAAVFVDGQYVGHVDRFNGPNQGILVAPGKRTFKVTLPGYKTFTTEMAIAADQRYEISTALQKGTVEDMDKLTNLPIQESSEPIADANQ